jgi:hypothetical protein
MVFQAGNCTFMDSLNPDKDSGEVEALMNLAKFIFDCAFPGGAVITALPTTTRSTRTRVAFKKYSK